MSHTNIRDNESLKFKNGVIDLNGVLFLHQENSGQQQFEYLLGNKEIGQESLKSFAGNMRRNIRYTSSKNIPYKHVIFPSKPYVLRDEFNKIGLDISKIGTIDLYNQECVYFPELIANDYYLDDTHVNHRGILKIITSLVSELLGVDLPNGEFITEFSLGDLGRMYGSSPLEKEKFSHFEGTSDSFKLDFNFNLKSALKGNSGHLDVNINSKALINKRLLIFGDSFFRSSLPILNKVFKEVIYFRSPFIINEMANILEPDIIFTGNAERYLVNVPSAKTTPPYFLNYFSSGFDTSKLDESEIKLLKSIFSGRKNPDYQNFIKSLKIQNKDIL